METIISAIITAVATVLVGALGLFTGRKKIQKKPAQDLYMMQMVDLLEPLESMFIFGNSNDANQLLTSIEMLFKRQYRILPPNYLDELLRIKSLENLHWDDFTELRLMSSAYYNWLRRKFAYPYKAAAIKLKKLPFDCTTDSLKEMIRLTSHEFFAISAMMIVLILTCQSLGIPEVIDISDRTIRSFAASFCLSLYYIILENLGHFRKNPKWRK